jgi:hypothetical protein
MGKWPEWWEWDLEISPHILKRMVDRSFSETDLRLMLEQATGLRPDHVPGRWVVETALDDVAWEVIVEPDDESEALIAVTAYKLS